MSGGGLESDSFELVRSLEEIRSLEGSGVWSRSGVGPEF